MSDTSGATTTLFQTYQYDRLGQQTHEIEAGPAGLIDTATEYNAFGEVIRQGTNNGRQAYFDYDYAGNLWRTNSGDGVDKVFMVDLQGNVTAKMISTGIGGGNIDLKSFVSVDQIAGLTDLNRTDTRHDLLGRVVQQSEGQRLDVEGGVLARAGFTHANILSSASPLFGESGVTGFAGTNTVAFTWASLAALGSGDIKVSFQYTTLAFQDIVRYDEAGNPVYAGTTYDEGRNPVDSPASMHAGETRAMTQNFTADEAASGVTFNWSDARGNLNGGINRVTRLTILKMDVNGNWQQIVNTDSLGYAGNSIEVTALADPATVTQLQLRWLGFTGEDGWTNVPLINYGNVLRYDASHDGVGNYEYRLLTTAPGNPARMTSTGTIGLVSKPLAGIVIPLTFGPAGHGILAWASQDARIDQVFRIRPVGGRDADSRVIAVRGNGYDGVDLSNLAAGTYEYELLWSHAGEGSPYAHALGRLTVEPPIPPRWVPPVGLPAFSEVSVDTGTVGGTIVGVDEDNNPVYSGGTTVTSLQWLMPANAAATVFQYRLAGSSTWATLPVTNLGAALDESGNPVHFDESGNAVSGHQQANVGVLAAGVYDYEVLVSPPGSSTPDRHSIGQFTVYGPGSGHYETRQVQVQVPVTVTPPDVSNYIIGYTGSGPTYGPPVVVGYDGAGNPVFGQGYGRDVTARDEAGNALKYGPVHAIAYTVYHTETVTVSVPVQVAVGQSPVYVRDESGSVIYETVQQTQYRVRQQPIHETRSRPREVSYQVRVQDGPIILGVDEGGTPIYQTTETGGIAFYSHYETYSYTTYDHYEVVVGYYDEYYPVQVSVTQPVYARDESGNIVYQTDYQTRYQNQTRQVQVGVTVTPTDPSQYVISSHSGVPEYGPPVVVGTDEDGHTVYGQGYGLVNGVVQAIPYTVYQPQYHDESVWVPGSTPPATVINQTPVYRPGYTINGQPAQYAATSTNANGVAAVTQSDLLPVQDVNMAQSALWLRPVINQTVDRWGNVTQINDARSIGWNTTYLYNANNQLIRETRPDANGNLSADSAVTDIYYDRLGRQVAVRDANGNVNGTIHDAAGNLIQERHADGGVITYSYNVFGDRTRSVDAMGHVTDYIHDKMGRLTQTRRYGAEIFAVDGNNNLQAVRAGTLAESSTYDQAGRKLTATDGNGDTVTYSYDRQGNITRIRQASGRSTVMAYDNMGNKVSETDGNGYTATWTYSHFGQLQGHTDLSGVSYTYTYDNARQLTRQASGHGQNLRYSYDAAGQVVRIDDLATGQTTLYSYDLAGNHVREKTISAGTVVQDNSLGYDALGRLRYVADGRVNILMYYDRAGNRIRIFSHVINTLPTLNSADIQHDSDRYFAYDAMNRQTLVDGVDSSGAINAAQGHRITYDANGNRLTDTSWGTHVSATEVITGHETHSEYVMVGVSEWTPQYGYVDTTVPVYSTSYTASQGESTESYHYDSLNRLQEVKRDGTMVDTRFYDGASRVVQTGPNGTLPQAYVAALNGTTSTGATAAGLGTETRTNRYNQDGQLVHQVVRKSDNAAK
ncbi:MAG: hypothetical protein ACRYGK_03215, partial [Janthinobacterium lividum]